MANRGTSDEESTLRTLQRAPPMPRRLPTVTRDLSDTDSSLVQVLDLSKAENPLLGRATGYAPDPPAQARSTDGTACSSVQDMLRQWTCVFRVRRRFRPAINGGRRRGIRCLETVWHSLALATSQVGQADTAGRAELGTTNKLDGIIRVTIFRV